MPTVLTRREHIVPGCDGEALLHVSHGTALNRVNGLAAGVGWLNAPLAGFIAFVDYASATSAEQTSTRHSCHWRALSSAGGTSKGFVRDSKPLEIRQSYSTWSIWGV